MTPATVGEKMSGSILCYVVLSLTNLELMRRGGEFQEDRIPPDVAWAVDQLAADCALVWSGDEEVADQLRNRTPVRGGTA